jgi:hypothetical protein
MNPRLNKSWWWAGAILIILVVPRIHIRDDLLKAEICLGVVVILAFFVAGVGRTLICLSLAAFLGLGLLTIFLIHPYAILFGWMFVFSGAAAVCVGTGIRYLFDVLPVVPRWWIFRYPIQFGDDLTRRLITRAGSRLIGCGFWVETLALNSLCALCISFLALVSADRLVEWPGLKPSWERTNDWAVGWLGGAKQPGLLGAGLWIGLFMFFFALFMWRSSWVAEVGEDPRSGGPS